MTNGYRYSRIGIIVAFCIAMTGGIASAQTELEHDEAELIRKLEASVSYSFVEGTSLDEVLQTFRDEFELPIELDEEELWGSLSDLGSRGLSRDYLAEDVPLRTLLDVVFLQERLVWTVYEGRIVVTTPSALNDGRFAVIRYYDVSDRICDLETDELFLPPDFLVNLLRSAIESPPKTGKDGPGAMGWSREGGDSFQLGVRHSFFVHESIERLLTELRRMDVPEEVRPDPSHLAAVERYRELMSRRLSFESEEPTILQVHTRLEETLGTPIITLERIRPSNWVFEHLVDSDCTVEEGIDFLCRGLVAKPVFLRGAIWLDEEDEFPQPIRVYDVSDLVGGMSPEEFTEIIQEIVAPESWEKWGGAGYSYVIPQRHGAFLVVRQTASGFLELDAFLQELRLVANEGPSMSEEEWESAQDDWKNRRDLMGRRNAPRTAREILPLRINPIVGKDVSQEEIVLAADGINRFAFDLYEQLAETDEDGNVFFAPGGISNIVAVPYMAASGETADEIRRVMHFPAPPDAIGPIYAALALATEGPAGRSASSSESSAWPGGMWSVPESLENETLDATILPQFDDFAGFGDHGGGFGDESQGPYMGTFNGPPCDEFQELPNALLTRNVGGLTSKEAALLDLVPSPIRMANGLWIQPDVPFQESFLGDAEKYFGATVAPLDFSDPNHAAQVINQWSLQKTQGLIYDLFDPSHFPENTVSFFANGIYYEAYWNVPFSPRDTEWNQDFSRFDCSVYPIPLMVKDGKRLPYCEHNGTQVVRLDYEHAEFEMLLLLPPEGEEAFEAFEASLSQELLTEIAGSLEKQLLNLRVPRFEMTSDIPDLPDALKSLGMTRAFDTANAEFPGVLEGSNPFWLGEGAHRALLQVTEEKTVAAAMGGVSGGLGGLPPTPTEMRIDRPFLLMIRHEPTGMIVFLGRVVEPTPSTQGAW